MTVEAIRSHLEAGVRARQMLAADPSAIARAADVVVGAINGGGKVVIFGNGGSAADSQHIAAELTGRFRIERGPLPAVALTTDTSALTAIANDYGYDQVFERQLRALGRAGDVAIGISTSGNSPNVLSALRAGRELGMATIGLTGEGGGALAERVDVWVAVPTDDTALIQELHVTIGHCLCDALDRRVRRAFAPASPVVTLQEAGALRAAWRAAGETVVWTNGCFDLLHVGHVASLRAARALGDRLIVGLNDDGSVRRLKGAGRPVVPATLRARLVGALEPVDAVVVFPEDTPEASISALQPDVHCKGAEYADGRPIPEAETVRAYGGRVEFLPLVEGVSTSAMLAALATPTEAADG